MKSKSERESVHSPHSVKLDKLIEKMNMLALQYLYGMVKRS